MIPRQPPDKSVVLMHIFPDKKNRSVFSIFANKLEEYWQSIPPRYREQPQCTGFIARVPTVWDETMALDIDLSFLPSGKYSVELFRDDANSDIITYHLYSNRDDMAAGIAEMKKQNRPVICTEWMARPAGSSYEKDLPLFQSEKVAAYGWFHDVLHADGTPYRIRVWWTCR